MKKKLLNQQGASLIMAIIALAVITGTSTLVFQSNKEVKVDKVRSRSKSAMEMERNRISSLLADVTICSSAANFGGKAAINGDITFNLVTASGQVFLSKGAQYHNRTLRVSNIRTRAIVTNDANYAAYNGTPKGYVLEVSYDPDVAGNSKILRSNIKGSLIKIPMYMRVNAGNIVECYAISQNDQINIAIKDACSPVTATANKNTTLNSGSANANTINDCEHNATFNASNATSCDNVDVGDANDRSWIVGYEDLTTTNGGLNIPLSQCRGLNTACAANESAFGITNSTANCSFAGGSRDGACGAGQIIYHTSGTSTTCVTVNCPTTAQFVQSVNTGGAVCYAAPTTTCGANQYVKVFNSGGADTCAPLPVMSGNCGGSDYAQSITRATGTLNGTLNCTYYNRTKSCAGANVNTFVSSFGASTTASCTTF